MRSHLLWLVIAAVSLPTFGCVAQSESDRQRADNAQLRQQVEDLKARLQGANSTIEVMRNQPPVQDPALIAALEEEKALRQGDRERFEAALAEQRERIRRLAEMQGGGVLPEELDRALVELAQSNPQLMTYDSERGMVKFESDLTFALGSTSVNPQAVESLKRLGGILRGSAADGYEIRVVGHTDNVPVTNPANRQKYGDNWGISAARAISVMRVLVEQGVPPHRVAVVGHGEYRPVAPNAVGPQGRPAGSQANRRVEVYLVASNYDASQAPASEPAGTGTGRSTPPTPPSGRPTNNDNGDVHK